MNFDLAAMARRAGKRSSGSVTLAPIIPTQALQDDLARIYMRVVKGWAEAARDRILPAYSRALERRAARDGMVLDDATSLGDLFRELGPEFERLVLSFSYDLKAWAVRVEKWERDRWINAVYSATGVDLTVLLSGYDVEVTIADLLAWNASLVADVSQQAQSKISASVFQGYQQRMPVRDVAKSINDALKFGAERSRRVAADQTRKLSAALAVQRSLQAGLTDFVWVHSRKLHPREYHKARDGKVYKLVGDPVVKDDMPGQAPFCGCVSRGYFKLD